MARHTFCCLDGHTCGNPVRLVAGGGPRLAGGACWKNARISTPATTGSAPG